jgi:hypothetical protein
MSSSDPWRVTDLNRHIDAASGWPLDFTSDPGSRNRSPEGLLNVVNSKVP